jgi:hypothetical protein
MKVTKKQIEVFFAAYQKRFNNSLGGKKVDVKGTVNSFAAYFVEAHPGGVLGGKNDKKFESLIKKGNEQYKKIGAKSMTIRKLDFINIDDMHAMVTIRWKSNYEKEDTSQVRIDFDVTYFVQSIKGKLKIFAYVTGDEQKVLKGHGLI